MSAHARNHCIVDEVHRISRACILGELIGSEIESSQVRIDDHVLEHRAETDRIPDLRLFFAREINAFGVAATFEIEDAAIAPAMLVIPDQPACRICRQRGLTRARQPEK